MACSGRCSDLLMVLHSEATAWGEASTLEGACVGGGLHVLYSRKSCIRIFCNFLFTFAFCSNQALL